MPYNTNQYEGLMAETVTFAGYGGDRVHAYVGRPLGPGPFPAVVCIPHALGWTEYHKELVHRFAYHGYIAICPDIWCRVGHGSPEDVLAMSQAKGGLPDIQVVGDNAGAAAYLRSLPVSNGKVGIIGSCSGGRHSYLTACRTQGVFQAAVNCWGGGVIMPKERLSANMPVQPLDYTKDLSAPLLGLFGNEDQAPSPAQVDTIEAQLKEHNKTYEFHRYDGAGHGFFYYHLPMFRQQQSMEGWKRVWAFLGKYLP